MIVPQRITSAGTVVPAFQIDQQFREQVMASSWRSHAKGYLISKRKRSRVYLHRLVWLLKHGRCPEMLDHINGDKTDNRLCNLRPATCSLNNRNRRAKRRSLPHGVTLAARCKSRPYRAGTSIAGRYVHIGYYASPEQASAAYESYRAELLSRGT